MPHIDYFFSVLSPYAYLAGTRLEEIAARHGAQIAYRPVDAPTLAARAGGGAMRDLPAARMAYRAQDLARIARRQHLPLNPQPLHWPSNPAPASYAIIAAQAAGGGRTGALVHALMRACWAEDRDVAEDAVIRACLADSGFDAGLADRGLLAGAETYAANLEEAVTRGVFGVPFYLLEDGQAFWGQDRLDDLDWYLAGGG